MSEATVKKAELTFLEQVGRFVTNPIVITLLFIFAAIGIVIELFSPGFGFPGIIGLTSLLLFFFGHMIAGLAGYEVLLLFFLGVGFLILELFIPGWIAGTLGIVLVFLSIFLTGGDAVQIGTSLFIALVVSAIVIFILMKYYGKRLLMNSPLVLQDVQKNEQGYISNSNRSDLVGKNGTTLTALRPAGMILVEGERIDVVSEGGFIETQQEVTIIKVDGPRIVVRKQIK
jgi:membrane-bound serine protease (ClpP class)